MNYRRNHPNTVAFKEKVFVIGGSRQPGKAMPLRTHWCYVDNMEMFTPPLPQDRTGTGQWTILNNMPDINRIVSLAACKDGIVAFGESLHFSKGWFQFNKYAVWICSPGLAERKMFKWAKPRPTCLWHCSSYEEVDAWQQICRLLKFPSLNGKPRPCLGLICTLELGCESKTCSFHWKLGRTNLATQLRCMFI